MIMGLQIDDSFYSAMRKIYLLYINNSGANKISKTFSKSGTYCNKKS